MHALNRTWTLVFGCLISLICLAPAGAGRAAEPAATDDARGPAFAWQAGDIYEIRAERRGIGERLRGTLVKVTPRWIVLHVETAQQITDAKTGWGDAPLIGPFFRRKRTEKVEQFVWVPRDAALIEKHQPLAEPEAIPPPPGDDPPRHMACTVELAGRTQVGRRDGGLEAVTAKQLTLAVPRVVAVEAPSNGLEYLKAKALGGGPESRTEVSRHELPLSDVLCVRMANYEAAARRAVAR
jgi:hypothetical protein